MQSSTKTERPSRQNFGTRLFLTALEDRAVPSGTQDDPTPPPPTDPTDLPVDTAPPTPGDDPAHDCAPDGWPIFTILDDLNQAKQELEAARHQLKVYEAELRPLNTLFNKFTHDIEIIQRQIAEEIEKETTDQATLSRLRGELFQAEQGLLSVEVLRAPAIIKVENQMFTVWVLEADFEEYLEEYKQATGQDGVAGCEGPDLIIIDQSVNDGGVPIDPDSVIADAETFLEEVRATVASAEAALSGEGTAI